MGSMQNKYNICTD